MKSRPRSAPVLVMGLMLLLAALLVPVANAVYPSTFDTFAAGTIDRQFGWSTNDQPTGTYPNGHYTWDEVRGHACLWARLPKGRRGASCGTRDNPT
jgi:hypothetical protein